MADEVSGFFLSNQPEKNARQVMEGSSSPVNSRCKSEMTWRACRAVRRRRAASSYSSASFIAALRSVVPVLRLRCLPLRSVEQAHQYLVFSRFQRLAICASYCEYLNTSIHIHCCCTELFFSVEQTFTNVAEHPTHEPEVRILLPPPSRRFPRPPRRVKIPAPLRDASVRVRLAPTILPPAARRLSGSPRRF